MNSTPLHDRIARSLDKRRDEGLLRTLPSVMRGGIDVSSNSYLALHENVDVQAAADALSIGQVGGNLASRLIDTRSPLYESLEHEIAAWKATDSALVFNSGYAANLGILQAVCSRDTEVFSDRLNHASIVDGIRLSGATMTRYAHCDAADLRARLHASYAKERLIVTDTVFSMDGDRAPLADICELAQEFQCMVMVDEAHAAGIFGAGQSGLVEELGLDSTVDIRMGTLSKSVAGLGGYCAGSALLRDALVNNARSLIYSTALPHSVVAWDLAAVRHIRSTPGLGARLLDRAGQLRAALKGRSFDVMTSTTQIVPCVVGDARAAVALSRFLSERGIRAPAIRPPTVPNGTARVRFSVHLGLSDGDVTAIIDGLSAWRALQ